MPRKSLHEEGGPAFANEGAAGMSLRDYFAAQAIAGLLALPVTDSSAESYEDYAASAYRQADALLKAREQ